MSVIQNDDSSELDLPSSQTIESSQATGTKIGEVTDFEKELIDNDVIEEKKSQSESIVVETKEVKQKGMDSFDDIFESHVNESFSEYVEEQIVTCKVRMVKKAGVLVDFNYKSDGFIPSGEISDEILKVVEEGSEFFAMIEKLETKEGYSLLSESKAKAEMIWDDLIELMNNKEVVDVVVKKVNQKGYIVNFKDASGFLHPEDDVTFSEGDTAQALIINVDKRRKKVLFSTRNIKNMITKKETVLKLFDTINVGDKLTGTVSGIKKFGVFVNVGDVEGLIHISELTWRRISHPSDVVELGDEVDVAVLAMDRETCKLSLGMKQLTEDPWKSIDENYEIGQVVDGKVVRITDFGAFILITNDLEGLVHISEISVKRINDLSSVLVVGDQVKAKVIKLTKHDQKIGLSLKYVDQDNQALIDRLEAI